MKEKTADEIISEIEEARERLEKRIKDIWFSTTYSQEQEEKDLKILLSDYKRVLKENEILKEEKEQTWEEWNNLQQGSYETEQKLKQQIKQLQKENEGLKNKIMEKDLEIIGKEEETKADMREIIEQYYTANEDCVSKQKIKDKINELQNDLKYIACGNTDCNKCFSEYRGSNFIYCYAYHQINILQELLKEGEE